MKHQHQVSFAASIKIGHQNAEALVICDASDVTPVVMWVEVEAKPVPTWVWDLIEADIALGGPCAIAYMTAKAAQSSRPLPAYVAISTSNDERDIARQRERNLINGGA